MIKVGVELEAFAEDAKGAPADWRERFPERFSFPLNGEDSFAALTTDAAPDQLELVSDPHPRGADIAKQLESIAEELCPEDWTLQFQTFRSAQWSGGKTPWMPKPRYRALWDAVREENSQRGHLVQNMANCAATQFHVGVPPDTENGVALLSFLDHIGPYVAKQVAERYGINNRGHLRMWRFAPAHRLSQYPGFARSVDELKERFVAVPRLLTKVSDSPEKWEVDLRSAQQWGNPSDEANNWQFARPRVSYGTIEFRPCPSLKPEWAGEIADELIEIANAFIEHTRGRCVTSPVCVADVFCYLHNRVSSLAPSAPLSKKEWKRLVLR